MEAGNGVEPLVLEAGRVEAAGNKEFICIWCIKWAEDWVAVGSTVA